ncbi:hypothetical protein [Terrabacter sp. Ter38]|uniref:hypothetical protein n=1 Tax=Terrabacter sp. Ter38 TaxID=2926030 RepID=UPI00211893E0|nr:hypothetical protein [Terrabacter sp. Ter38]
MFALGLVLLTGCGSADAPGREDGRVATSVPAHDATTSAPVPALPSPDPGMLPVRAPSAEFAERARVVAHAVRRAGPPPVPTQPVLLSSWALVEGFDTGEQKVAWTYGHVTLAPAVDQAVAGSGTLRMPDGSSRPVALVGVRPALDRALEGALSTPRDCDGVPAALCRLVVSEAVLVEAAVRTGGGDATVPVWRLTVDGLAHPLSVIAVADGVFAQPQHLGPLPGLPDAPPEFHGADSLRRVEGTTIDVGIGGGGCDSGLVAHVVELDDMVVVGGTTPPPPKDTACTLDYASRPARLHLAQPLGTRPVIDIASGRPRVLGVPPF